MKIITILIFNAFFSIQSMATEQMPDILIYGNDTVRIYSNPLEYNKEVLSRDTAFLIRSCMSTACWRGYQAIWKIEDEALYLLKIIDCCDERVKADMKLLFQDKWVKNRVKADWYSGKLVIPIGKAIYGEHMGYSRVHEFEELIKVKNGKIVQKKRVDNRKTDVSYLNSDKLSIHLVKHLNKKILEDIWNNKFELNFYADIEGNEKRQVTRVEFKQIVEIRHKSDIKKAILKINNWDILYRHGKKTKLPWLYPVKINRKKLKKYKKYWR